MGRVLEFLKPLAARMKFETVAFKDIPFEVINICTKFIEIGSVEDVLIHPDDSKCVHL